MKQLLYITTIFFIVSYFSGCVIVADKNLMDNELNWQSRQEKNRNNINALEINLSRIAVQEKLGLPDFSEAFSQNGANYRILFYRTQRLKEDGNTTKDETTPLIFKNDRLIGWGNDLMNRIYAAH